MEPWMLLGLSVVLQLWAAFLALRLIRLTEGRLAWGLIAGAIFLMVLRRVLSLVELERDGSQYHPLHLYPERLALGISFLMCVGLAAIRPLFERNRKAREALKASEERYRLIFDGSRDAVFIAGADARFIDVNRAACALTGYCREELCAMSIPDLHQEGDRHAFETYFDRIMAGEPVVSEAKIMRKDGTKIDAEFNNSAITLSGVRVMHTVARDITQRRKAQAALRASEERYRALVEDMPAMVCRFLPDGTLTFVNKAYGRYFGKRQEALVGANFFAFIPTEEHASVRAHFMSLDREKPILTYEHQAIAPDQTVVWQEWTDRALFDAKDRIVEYQSVGQDITERKTAERVREELIARLEAQKMELERFTYTVSHDLRSPLVTIRGFIGFLEQDVTRGDLDRFRLDIAHIREASDRMERLLRDLLHLSRIGHVRHPPEESSLYALAMEAVELVTGQIRARGVEVTVDKELPAVVGDPSRLLEVYQNLIENAVKFMGDQPDPHVEIGVRRQEDENVYFVRDNGMGIEPPYHERIFRLFERFDPSTDGTGVGLALVKRIVTLHGGRIWVESEGPGQGSCFCFTLGDNLGPIERKSNGPAGQTAADFAGGR